MTRLFACKLVEEAAFEKLKPLMLSAVPGFCAAKALSYYHSNDAQRHLTGELLARYAIKQITGDHHKLPFTLGEKGKPHPDGYNGIHFNVSHSGVWVIVATSNAAVGVDVERMRKVPEGVAYRFFSEPEKQMLDEAENDIEKAHIFFTLWTLKESFLKATGKGLTRSLNTFTIVRRPEGGYSLAPDDDTEGFYLYTYPFEEGYKLAACSAENNFSSEVIIVKIDDVV
jgi:4'-phosphopantetheinyl transferase